MSTPTFNGHNIFDSTGASGDYTEGNLDVLDYSGILQPIHFNGENGMRYLHMGWGDRHWRFTGIISALNVTALKAKLAAIEAYIDDAQTDPSSYKTLVTSFGDTFHKAQIHKMNRTTLQGCIGGFLCHVVIDGVISGMSLDGGD